jgi:hypothetical protein
MEDIHEPAVVIVSFNESLEQSRPGEIVEEIVEVDAKKERDEEVDKVNRHRSVKSPSVANSAKQISNTYGAVLRVINHSLKLAQEAVINKPKTRESSRSRPSTGPATNTQTPTTNEENKKTKDEVDVCQNVPKRTKKSRKSPTRRSPSPTNGKVLFLPQISSDMKYGERVAVQIIRKVRQQGHVPNAKCIEKPLTSAEVALLKRYVRFILRPDELLPVDLTLSSSPYARPVMRSPIRHSPRKKKFVDSLKQQEAGRTDAMECTQSPVDDIEDLQTGKTVPEANQQRSTPP